MFYEKKNSLATFFLNILSCFVHLILTKMLFYDRRLQENNVTCTSESEEEWKPPIKRRKKICITFTK